MEELWRKVWTGIFAVIGAVILLYLLFGSFAGEITSGIRGARSSVATDNATVVTYSSTNATMTLSGDLYQAIAAEVVVTSDIAETPVPYSYDVDAKALTVTGLEPSSTRTLTATYNAEHTELGWRLIGPFLVVIIFGFGAVAILWGQYRDWRRG